MTNERCFVLLKLKLISMKVTITKQQILQNVSWGAEIVICTKTKAKRSVKNDEILFSETEATSSIMARACFGVSFLESIFLTNGKAPAGAKVQHEPYHYLW